MASSNPIGAFIESAAQPVVDATRSPAQLVYLIQELGWEVIVTDVIHEQLAFVTSLTPVVDQLESLLATLAENDEQAEAGVENEEATAEVVAEIALLATAAIAAVTAIAANPPSVPDLPEEFRDGAFWASIAADLPEYLLLRWLQLFLPKLYAVAKLLGVISEEPIGANRVRRHLHLDQLSGLLTDPNHLPDEYGWGDDFRYSALLTALADLAATFGVEVIRGANQDRSEDELRLALTSGGELGTTSTETGIVVRGAGPVGATDGLGIGGFVGAEAGGTVDLGDQWTLAFEFEADGVAGVEVRPGQIGPMATADASWTLGVKKQPEGGWTLIAPPGPSLVVAGVDAFVEFSMTGTQPELDIGFALAGTETSGLVLTIDPSEGDSFIGSVLESSTIEAELDLAVAWSSATGLSMAAGAAIEWRQELGLQLGPIELIAVTVRIEVPSDGSAIARFEGSVDAGAEIGPIAASVAGIGLRVSVVEDDASAGGVKLLVGFKPPTGLGLAIDAGVARGGGYLDIDHEAGRYEGILDLQVVAVGISAVAIIETKLPDVDGWSAFFALYISIPSIQLGFGFALTGVGGVAGINRSIDTEALGTAVRSGALSTVLFPDDPIAEAPAIIDTFSSIFPPADDTYVFGPIIQIAWGTPSLIEGELGVVIQVPDPIVIAILGSVSMALPTKELDLIAINIDVAGVVDFGAGTIAVDASVHNSHVIGFALSGDIALRASLRGRPEFLFSMGGFHPDFDPPAGFPALRRMSLGLNGGPLLEIRFDCYLALTSNTVQFGAAFSIWAKVAGFGIDGGAEFDAIIQFDPFKLKTSIGLHIAVTAVGVDLAGIWLSGSLEGPNPWHIIGKAEFKVLGIKESIRVDEKIGSKQSEPAITGPQLLSALAQQLDDDNAWSVVDLGGTEVTLASSDDSTALRTDPVGKVVVSQSLLPINVEIECFGQVADPGHTYFEIIAEAGLIIDGEALGWFAPAQFFDLEPKERLSAPSFDEHPAGVEFGGAVSFGPERTGTLEHEMDYVDPYFEDLAAEAGEVPERVSRNGPRTYTAGADPRRMKRGLDRAPIASGVNLAAALAATKEPVFGLQTATFEVADPVTGAIKTAPASFMTAYAAAGTADVIKLVVAS